MGREHGSYPATLVTLLMFTAVFFEATMPPTCPDCKEEILAAGELCRACQKKREATQHKTATARQSRPRVSQFGIGSMMLAVAGVGVLLGLFRAAPGLAFLLVMFLAPALIRGWVVISREQVLSMAPLSWGEKGMRFLSSLGLVIMVGLSTGVAFFATCFGIAFVGDLAGMGMDAIASGVSLGLFVQMAVTVGFITWLVYNYDPEKNRVGDIAFICASTVYSQAVAGGVAVTMMAITGQNPPLFNFIAGGFLLPFIVLVISFFLGCIGVARKPRFLACMAVGISTSFFVLGVLAVTVSSILAQRSGFPNTLPNAVGFTIALVFYIGWLIGGPMLGYFFYTRWEDSDYESRRKSV